MVKRLRSLIATSFACLTVLMPIASLQSALAATAASGTPAPAAPPASQSASPAPSSAAATSAASPAAAPIALDLSSATQSLSAKTLLTGTAGTATILQGGTPITVNASTQLTPAQYVALTQVLGGSAQTIQLGATGAAVGGTLTLAPSLTSNLSSLVIPKGVAAIDNFALSSSLNLSGNFSNAGTFYAISSSPQTSSATINALNIFNQPGGLLTSVLPAGGLAGYNNLFGNLSLSLNAVQQIMNAGTIASAAGLNLTAGTSIVNALPNGVSGIQPAMQALTNINFSAPSITNAGVIASQLANANLATNILNNSGTIQAMLGSLSVQSLSGNSLAINNLMGSLAARDLISLQTTVMDKLNPSYITVAGGTFSADRISVVSPGGDVRVSAEAMNGNVYLAAGAAVFGVTQGNLMIAGMNITGDPIISAAGNVSISPGAVAGDYIVLAGGNITQTAGGSIDASGSPGVPGGKIVLAAGVNFTVTNPGCVTCVAGTDYSIGAPSVTGGNINAPNIDFVTNTNTIDMQAHAGTLSAGTISINNAMTDGLNGAVAGSAGGAGGNISLVADGAISANWVLATGGFGLGGGNGGNGANVSITSNTSSVNVIALGAHGGGGGGAITGAGGAGGNAGAINITANSIGSVFEIDSMGGGGGGGGQSGVANGGKGGNGGSVVFLARTGGITVNNEVSMGGGGGGGAGTGGGTGGAGGLGGSFAATSPGAINLGVVLLSDGGSGGNGNAGGAGGGGGSYGAGGGGGGATAAGLSGSGGGGDGPGGGGGTGGAGVIVGGDGGSDDAECGNSSLQLLFAQLNLVWRWPPPLAVPSTVAIRAPHQTKRQASPK